MRSRAPRSNLGWAAIALVAVVAACSPSPAPIQPTEQTAQTATPLTVDADQIIFHSDPNGASDFYAMDADGSNLIRLTEANTDAFPAVSPDGQWIAYSTKNHRDIFVLNLADALQNPNGAQPINLTRSAGQDAAPAWSPDSKRLAFDSYEDGFIYVMDLPEPGGVAAPQALTQGFQPNWSPSDDRIVFFSDRDGDAEIYAVNTDGSAETQLTDNDASDYTPRWSPDGLQILFISERDGNAEIYVMNADGSGQTNVSDDPAHDEFAFWSPEGARILYVSYQGGADPFFIGDGDAEIFVVNPDGSDKTNLTDNDVWDGDPGWSPDGKRILFTRREGPNRQGHITVMAADGSGPVRLAGEPGEWNDCCAVWRP
jgi:TolB protein